MSGEQDLPKAIKDAFIQLAGVDKAKELAQEALKTVSPLTIVQAMRDGLETVGEKYKEGEFFLAELIMAGIMSKELTDTLKPHLIASKSGSKGKIIIGTIKGDVHDIGKNIVAMMLTSAGFDVDDLGVDVSTEKFVEAVKEKKPDILGMSCLLTVGMEELRKVISKLEEESVRSRVKVMVGGRPLTPEFSRSIGADGYAKDAIDAVRVAESLVERS